MIEGFHTDTIYYSDYCWKQGIPYGLGKTKVTGYKIVSDPYRKWISIEKYRDSQFETVIYDSRFLDFRKLQSEEHTAWEKTLIQETKESSLHLIRNQDDRVVYVETAYFQQDRCVECQVHSPQGTLLSVHKMSYTDDFNGVTLFDSNQHLVMIKEYLYDTDADTFTDLLKEVWDFTKND